MSGNPNNIRTTDRKPAPEDPPRKRKTPIEAANANIDNTIAQLEGLGAKLFKIDKTDLLDEVTSLLEGARELKKKLAK